MILVTGATGQLGTAVVQTLLQKTSANQIAALVRDESKASALKEKWIFDKFRYIYYCLS